MDAKQQRKKRKIENLIVDLHQDLFQYLSRPHHLERNLGTVDLLLNVEMNHGLLQREVLSDIETTAPTENHTMITEKTLMKGIVYQELHITMKSMETILRGFPQVIREMKRAQAMTVENLDICNMKEEDQHHIEKVRMIIIEGMPECVEITRMSMITRVTEEIHQIEINNDLDLPYVILGKKPEGNHPHPLIEKDCLRVQEMMSSLSKITQTTNET